jgi:hypothetical protein
MIELSVDDDIVEEDVSMFSSFRLKPRIPLTLMVVALLLAACSGITFDVGIATTTAPAPATTPAPTVSPTAAAETPAAPTAAPTTAPTEAPPQATTAVPATETPTGAETGGDQGGDVFVAPGADWQSVSDAQFGVRFQMPPGWTPSAGEQSRYEGPDGFVEFVGIGGPADVMTVCQNEADHVLMPYGTNPTVEPIAMGEGSNAGPTCLVTPSGDASMEGQHFAAVTLPQPRTLNGYTYEYLGVYGSGAHIRAILSSLSFFDPTSDAASSQPGDRPVIRQFDISRESDLAVGDAVTLNWQAYAERVEACYEYQVGGVPGDTVPGACVGELPANGSHTFTLEPLAEGDPLFTHFYLIAMNSNLETVADRYASSACQVDWFFDENTPRWCPDGPPRRASALAQQFEHGLMLRYEGVPDVVHLLLDEPTGLEGGGPRFDHYDPPIQSPPEGLAAPDGLYPPADEFYAVWNNAAHDKQSGEVTSRVSDQTGWAVGPLTSYEGMMQCRVAPYDLAACYVLGPEGGVYMLSSLHPVWAVPSDRMQ